MSTSKFLSNPVKEDIVEAKLTEIFFQAAAKTVIYIVLRWMIE